MSALQIESKINRSVEALKSVEEALKSHILSKNAILALSFNDKIAKTSSGQTINLHIIENSLKAELLIENQVQASEIKVILVGDPKVSKSGSIIGKNLGVEFDKVNKVLYIGKIKGLNGGSDEINEIESFIEVLSKVSENKNPFVHADIIHFLETFANCDEINLEEFINLPEDFIECIKKLIPSLQKFPDDRILAIKKEIKNELLNSAPIFKTWNSLDLILELNCFKRLAIDKSKKIIDYFIKETKSDYIEELLREYIGEDTILEEFIQNEDKIKLKCPELNDENLEEWNIETIISQINDSKPKENEGFMSLVEEGKDENYFKGKLLIYQDMDTYKIVLQSYIETFTKTKFIEVNFSKNTKIIISKVQTNYNVKLQHLQETGLAKYLIKKTNELPSIGLISISKGSRICEGEYQVKLNYNKLLSMLGLYDSYTYILENQNRTYLIEISKPENKKSVQSISLKFSINGRNEEIKKYQNVEVFDNENKVVFTKILEKVISAKKIDEYLKIEKLEDPNLRKFEQLKIIQEKFLKLRTLLKREEKIKNYLISLLFKNNLESLPDDVFEKVNELYPSLNIENDSKEIGSLYSNELNIFQDPKSILLKAVKDANYEELIDKRESIMVQKTIDLLIDSKSYLDKMKDKELIIIIGSTGSGKSTTSCYLLKAPLNRCDSHLGEKIVELNMKKIKDPLLQYPKIGQSIGTSETLYAQGYDMIFQSGKKGIMLCDCPGFRDTRGSEYRLCTNFSIDKAIKQADSIKAIILTIQYNTFLIERGNSALLAFEDLSDLIPAFMDNPNILESIFIIITKVDNIPNAKKYFKERINQHIKEANETFEKNFGKNQDEIDIKTQTQTEIENKITKWKKIAYLYEIDHIIFVNIMDVRERNQILKLLENSSPIEKRMFNNNLFTGDMINDFSDNLEISTHTWTEVIIPQFLIALPNQISECENQDKKVKKEINEKENEIKETEDSIKKSIMNRDEYLKEIDDLKKYKEMVDNKEMIYEDLVKLLDEKDFQMKEKSREEIESLKNKIESKKNKISEIKNEKQRKKEKKNQSKTKLKKKHDHKEMLSSGWSEIKKLKFLKKKPKEELVIDNKSSERLGIVKMMCSSDYYKGFAGDFTGKMHHYTTFDKNYRIFITQNKDYCNSNELEGDFKYSNNKNNFSKTAAIIGVNYHIEFDPHILQKEVWTISTTWKSNRDIPWFEINEIKKNSDMHKSEIINLENEINFNEKEIDRLETEIENLNSNLEKNETNLEDLTIKLEEQEKLVFKDSSSTLEMEIGRYECLIEAEKQREKDLTKYIKDCEDCISKCNEEIKKIMENKNKIMNKSAHFALVIKDKIHNLSKLRELCQNLVDFGVDSKKNVLNEIDKFYHCYDMNFNELNTKMDQELKRHLSLINSQENLN
ncbi:hypothetical protein SteCoe_31702 [Stentor coeruleus]|uniref:Uncharacterized protein n=1 Tax=Stentor coeruleus TaxID=5963 RepID=A0A1R2B143_9CILI|nr:hypothetical protein SteCoe_31702 [Stentor coeruleus]